MLIFFIGLVIGGIFGSLVSGFLFAVGEDEGDWE